MKTRTHVVGCGRSLPPLGRHRRPSRAQVSLDKWCCGQAVHGTLLPTGYYPFGGKMPARCEEKPTLRLSNWISWRGRIYLFVSQEIFHLGGANKLENGQLEGGNWAGSSVFSSRSYGKQFYFGSFKHQVRVKFVVKAFPDIGAPRLCRIN